MVLRERARACDCERERESEMNREKSMCTCVRTYASVGVWARVRLCIGVDGVYSRARKRDLALVCVESEVRVGSRTVRRGHRFASDVIVSVYTRQSSAD